MTKRVARIDYFTIDAIEQAPNGYLRVPAYLTRVGVFDYITEDGEVFRELRPADEVFNEDSKKTLEDLPITNDHPAQFLNTRNTRGISVGYTSSNVDIEQEKIKSLLTVFDQDTIDKIVNDGKREISCGYIADLEMTPGEFNGERYDAIQRNIRYNHVAIVDRGRAGPNIKIMMDSGKEETLNMATQNKTEKKIKEANKKQDKTEEIMLVKLKVGGKEFEVPQEVADALNRVDAKEADALKAENKDLSAKLDTNEGKVAALEDENKKLKDSNSREKLMDEARARLSLEDTAKEILGDEFKADAKDIEIKKAIIAKKNADIELENKTEEFVDGVFATITKNEKKVDEKVKKEKTEIANKKVEGKKEDKENNMSSSEARAKSIKDSKDAWKSN